MKVFVVVCALLSVAVAHTVPTGEQPILQGCFEKDSISCVQQMVRILSLFFRRFEHESVYRLSE